jgi:tetraacyldisaccharide 4'-kinase
MSLDASLQRVWYGARWLSLPLRPLEWLFRSAVAVRASMYRLGVLPSFRVAAPVVVVGNISVGGTGKTPVAAWLARKLATSGRRVGIVLRGYGGRSVTRAQVVTVESDPADVGDEAVLHARRRPHVVVVGADRVEAARLAVEQGAEVVVCDDGLQHLRLARDCEIAVVDGGRGLGNGRLLPAGPLREPPGRLDSVDAVVVTLRDAASGPAPELPGPPPVTARLAAGHAVNLRSGERRPLEEMRGAPVHAVAGIGHPEAFFDALRAAGLVLVPHPLPDHAALDRAALPFPAEARVLMTEKDAVKCRLFAGADWWYVEYDMDVGQEAASLLLTRVLECTGLAGAGVNLG